MITEVPLPCLLYQRCKFFSSFSISDINQYPHPLPSKRASQVVVKSSAWPRAEWQLVPQPKVFFLSQGVSQVGGEAFNNPPNHELRSASCSFHDGTYYRKVVLLIFKTSIILWTLLFLNMRHACEGPLNEGALALPKFSETNLPWSLM